VPDWSLPGGPKRVSFRSSQVAESYELGSPAFRGSADYRFLTARPLDLTTFSSSCRIHSLRVDKYDDTMWPAASGKWGGNLWGQDQVNLTEPGIPISEQSRLSDALDWPIYSSQVVLWEC
jgi:hypothetical protein